MHIQTNCIAENVLQYIIYNSLRPVIIDVCTIWWTLMTSIKLYGCIVFPELSIFIRAESTVILIELQKSKLFCTVGFVAVTVESIT